MAIELPRLYITEINRSIPHDNVYAFSPYSNRHEVVDTVYGLGHATITMEMSLTEGASDLLWELAKQRDGFTFGVERREWKCIWCERVCHIDERECRSCGGPRGWIL